MTRQAFIAPKRRALIFWSPKAGNTSLAHWFLNATASTKRRARMGSASARAVLNVGSTVGFDLARELIEQLGFDHYVLCRDPCARAVSAYRDKFVVKGRQPDCLDGFAKDVAQAIAGANWERRGISFIEYLEYVASKVKSRGSGEPDLNNHFNTQVPFDFQDFEYANILHLEQISEGLK